MFIDNRSEAYPASFVKADYLAINNSLDAWLALEDKYKFNTIYLHRNKAVDAYLPTLDAANWSVVFRDQEVVILLKNTSENQDLIEQYSLVANLPVASFAHNN